MHDPRKGSTPRLPNAFSVDFLRLDLERNEPAEASDPAGEGPWVVLPSPSGDWPEWDEIHGVGLQGEKPERGDPSPFLASGRSLALCAASTPPPDKGG